jgi:hypothetical protein
MANDEPTEIDWENPNPNMSDAERLAHIFLILSGKHPLLLKEIEDAYESLGEIFDGK